MEDDIMKRMIPAALFAGILIGMSPSAVPAETDLGNIETEGRAYEMYATDRDRSEAGVDVFSEADPLGTASMPNEALGTGALPELGEDMDGGS
jgi:hypothetical protein